MGTTFLNSLTVISTYDCCTLLLTCLEKAFHVGFDTFTTDNFKCMMRLNKFSLKKNHNSLIILVQHNCLYINYIIELA